jgi:ketosteroid isomerase-like protein
MAEKKKTNSNELKNKVSKYFRLIRDLRNGKESSVPALMELWDSNGTFEFAGSPPIVGTFRGEMAIATLYQNRLRAGGMQMKVETMAKRPKDVTLGVVDTEVTHVRTSGNRVIAAWSTTIGTKENLGFDVAGSHLFEFEDGKIKSLRVSVSPKADQSKLENLRFSDLSVVDVGRLSLAAWPVV